MSEPKLIAMMVIVTAVLLGCAIFEYRRVRKFRAKYPPISDDEFMARLPPETSRDIALRVRSIVAEQLGVDRERVYPESKFVDLID